MSLRRLHLILSLDYRNQSPLSTVRHSGHAHRTPKDLPEQISLPSRMGRCAVQQAAPVSTRAATRTRWPLRVLYAARDRPLSSVFVARGCQDMAATIKATTRQCRLLASLFTCIDLRGRSCISAPSLPRFPSSALGRLAASFSSARVGETPASPARRCRDWLKHLHRSSPRQFGHSPVQNEHTTVSPGLSAWRAMPADQPLQTSQSSSSGYQTPLPLRSTSTSPEFGSSGQAEQETVVFSSLPFSQYVLLNDYASPLTSLQLY